MSSSRPPATVSRRGAANQRLLHGVTQAADRFGFVGLTVERILAVAGVSRASFYAYFSNVEDCFLSAYRHHAERLGREIEARIARGTADELAVLDAIATFAIRDPTVARLLMREGVAAGPVGLLERDALIARIAGSMGGSGAVDLPLPVLIGGVFRYLVLRLSDGGELEALTEILQAWARTLASGASGPRWTSRLAPNLPECGSSLVPVSLRALHLQGSVRERIIRATALAIRAKGYQSITVADIVAGARISRRRFYNEFPSKAHAFMATYELAFQSVLAASAPAFFAERDWRERVWHAMLASTSFLAREPFLAYLGFVECYAIGPDYTLRVHDTQLAFTLFLEDGYRQRTAAESIPREFSALTVATIFEVAFEAIRRGPRFDPRRVQPLAVYIALAPFIGPDEAGEFVLGRSTSPDLISRIA